MNIPYHFPLLQHQLYMNGAWQDASNGATFPVYNPATETAIGEVASATEKDVLDAIGAAKTAFPLWSHMPAKERSKLLYGWYQLIMQHQEELATIMTIEQGKPLKESRGEIGYAASFVEWFAEEAKRIYGDIIPAIRNDQRLLVLKEPIGVAAAITPWNFPAAMITRKIAPALAAGCTILLKPSEETPYSALALAHLADKAGFPKGVFNIITGSPQLIGPIFTSHPDIRKLSFTGSTPVGKQLMRDASTTVKRLSLELGGNAPFIICDDAEVTPALNAMMASKFRNNGQTCICANRIFIQEGIYESLLPLLVKEVTKLRVGNGLDPDIDLGPLMNEKSVIKAERLLEDALKKGARLLTGGKRLAQKGYFFQPTVIDNVTPDMAITCEEIFAPIVAIQRFTSDEEVISAANNTPYGLAAYVFTTSHQRIWKFMQGLEYGMLGINENSLSNEMAPFGGIKQSGIGREGSYMGMEEYLQVKYVCLGNIQ